MPPHFTALNRFLQSVPRQGQALSSTSLHACAWAHTDNSSQLSKKPERNPELLSKSPDKRGKGVPARHRELKRLINPHPNLLTLQTLCCYKRQVFYHPPELPTRRVCNTPVLLGVTQTFALPGSFKAPSQPIARNSPYACPRYLGLGCCTHQEQLFTHSMPARMALTHI